MHGCSHAHRRRQLRARDWSNTHIAQGSGSTDPKACVEGASAAPPGTVGALRERISKHMPEAEIWRLEGYLATEVRGGTVVLEGGFQLGSLVVKPCGRGIACLLSSMPPLQLTRLRMARHEAGQRFCLETMKPLSTVFAMSTAGG